MALTVRDSCLVNPMRRYRALALTNVIWNTTQFDQKLSAPMRAARVAGSIRMHIEYGTAVAIGFHRFNLGFG